jgi:hypothetical protein
VQQTYTVRFARDDPETPLTMNEQIALARKAAQKLGVPNCESQPLYRVVETPTPARPGLTSSGLGRERLSPLLGSACSYELATTLHAGSAADLQR